MLADVGKDPCSARRAYRRFVEEGLDIDELFAQLFGELKGAVTMSVVGSRGSFDWRSRCAAPEPVSEAFRDRDKL